jgi:hypothetical protein
MRFDIDKPKLRKDLSYALKTSILKDAIDASGIDCNIHLNYWNPYDIPAGETILECFFWLPNENVDYDRFYVRAGTVKSEDRKIAQELLKEKVIPKFIDWIRNTTSQPANSTALKHNAYFNAVFKDSAVTIFHD